MGVAPRLRRFPLSAAPSPQHSATSAAAARLQLPLALALPAGLPHSHPCLRSHSDSTPRDLGDGVGDAAADDYNGHNRSSNNDHNRSNRDNSHSRRALLLQLAAAGTAAGLAAVGPTGPAAALPLGPLGPVKRVGGDKRTGLTAAEVAEVLRRDLAEGQYFVTGDLTREVFADDCRFVDPTNDVTGLSKYLTALGVLFDPQYSKVELLDIRVTDPRVIEADWRLGGYLAFPWNPRVEPFTGHTVYTLSEEGLVSEQRQSWSISGITALQQSFTPSWGPRRQLF